VGSGEAVSSAKNLIWGLAGVCVPCGTFAYVHTQSHTCG